MKIVVNANSLLAPLTGIGQYTFQLCQSLRKIDDKNEYAYYYGFYSQKLFKRESNGAGANPGSSTKLALYSEIKSAVKKIPVIGPAGRKARTAISKTVQFIRKRTFDLYFEPNFIPLEEIYSKKTATMVFDLSVLLYPQWHPRERVEIFASRFKKGMEKTDIIFTSTQFIKQQIMEHLKIAGDRIVVTPISCNKEIFNAREPQDSSPILKSKNIPEKFLLFVGSIEPRKNILTFLKSYAILPESVRRDLFLVFSGPAGWKNSDVFEFIEANKIGGKIIFLNYVTDMELSWLYRKAAALVYPSFYEGFGLPPLEALCCGCPAIVSDIPPHREVCGDAGLYFDPASPEQLSDAIIKVLQNPAARNELKAKGLARSENFSWESAARETLRVFESLAPVPS